MKKFTIISKTIIFALTLYCSAISFAQTTHELGWANDGTSTNQQITIEVGDTVKWTWGEGEHNLAATGSETFESDYSSTVGYEFSYTFENIGSTDYVCTPHATNMYGTVTVTAAVSTSNFDDGLLNNGDFESGSESWLVGVDDSSSAPVVSNNGNTHYSVDVTNAGNVWDVNTSQKVEIIDGTSYTLTFDAWGSNRSLLASGNGAYF